MSKLISSKIMAMHMFLLLLFLLWSQTNAQLQYTLTDSVCLYELNHGACATASDTVDNTDCCSAISDATHNDQSCMCNAINVDSLFILSLMTYCQATYNDLVAFCQVCSTTPLPPSCTSPPSDVSTPTTPSTTPSSTLYSPPPPSNDSTTGTNTAGTKSTINVIAIVVPVVIICMLIVIVVLVICVCRGKKKTPPNISNYPPQYPPHYPPNAYVDVKNDSVLLSQSVPVDVPPSAPTTMSSRVTPSSRTSRVTTTSSTASRVNPSSPAPYKGNFVSADSLQFELETLQIATDNFSNDNKIGRGGFGFVYKGILADGREIAIKRLSHDSGQGDTEFKAEIELLAKLQHKNLVKLVGFCIAKDEALLVYELMPNKSLDGFLFDAKKREELKWSSRYDIIRGIARGLLYLHEDSPLLIIHRDLKTANVLLDAKMNPKIADFGLARICALEQTHVDATRVVGTRGYMSPEYLHHGQFSVKSDIYAFGVIVLEIISGKRISSGFNNYSGDISENLLSHAWTCWREETPLAIMDPLIKDSCSSDEVVKCVHLSLLCVQDDMSKRPTMSTIVHMLNSNSNSVALPTPEFPLFPNNTTSDQSRTTSTTRTRTVTGSSGAVSSSSSPWSNFKNSR